MWDYSKRHSQQSRMQECLWVERELVKQVFFGLLKYFISCLVYSGKAKCSHKRDSFAFKDIVSFGMFEEKWMLSTSEWALESAGGTRSSAVHGVLPPFGHFLQKIFLLFFKTSLVCNIVSFFTESFGLGNSLSLLTEGYGEIFGRIFNILCCTWLLGHFLGLQVVSFYTMLRRLSVWLMWNKNILLQFYSGSQQYCYMWLQSLDTAILDRVIKIGVINNNNQ